jgi:hypothetical protein
LLWKFTDFREIHGNFREAAFGPLTQPRLVFIEALNLDHELPVSFIQPDQPDVVHGDERGPEVDFLSPGGREHRVLDRECIPSHAAVVVAVGNQERIEALRELGQPAGGVMKGGELPRTTKGA